MIQELVHFDSGGIADDALAAKESRVHLDQRLQHSHVGAFPRITHRGKKTLEPIHDNQHISIVPSEAGRYVSDGIRILTGSNERVRLAVEDEGQELQATSCKSTVRDLPLDDEDQAAAERHRLLLRASMEISNQRGSCSGYKSFVAVACTGDEALNHGRSEALLVGDLDDGREIWYARYRYGFQHGRVSSCLASNGSVAGARYCRIDRRMHLLGVNWGVVTSPLPLHTTAIGLGAHSIQFFEPQARNLT